MKDENQYKDPDKMANVLAMRQLKALGYEFVPGMKVSYIVTNGHKVPQEVEPYIDGRPATNAPDWEYYAERMAMSMARITEGLDSESEWDYQALLSGVQQKSLFSESFTQPPDEEPGDEDEDEERDDEAEVEVGVEAEPGAGAAPGGETEGAAEAEPATTEEFKPTEEVVEPVVKKRGKKKQDKKKPAMKLDDFL